MLSLVDLARLVLDYLRVLVWPLLLITGVLVLRVPLRRKLAEVLRLRLGSAEVEFAQAVQRLEENVATPAAYLAAPPASAEPVPPPLWEPPPWESPPEPVADDEDTSAAATIPSSAPPGSAPPGSAPPGAAPSGPPPPGPPPPGPAPGPVWASEEELRRSAVEAIMQDAAKWGYEMAKIGSPEQLVPVVEWSPDGRPRLSYAPEDVAKTSGRYGSAKPYRG